MGATASIMQVLSTVGSVSGQLTNANAIQAQGRYQSSILNQNATLTDQQAADAIVRGDLQAGQAGAATRQAIGQGRAGFAAQGIDVGTGSPLDVTNNAETLSALDIATIKNNAAREAWGYKVQGQNFKTQAGITSLAATNAADGARTGAFNTLLTGASNTYGIIRDARDGGRRNAAASNPTATLNHQRMTVPFHLGY